MKPDSAEGFWLDGERGFTLAELAAAAQLSESEVRELVDYGALSPRDAQAADWRFGGEALLAARAAGRLRADLALDVPALSLVLTLLERIGELEAQLRDLRAQLPRRFP